MWFHLNIWKGNVMTKMTREAASRIQSAACLAGSGVIKAGSFAARAMSAAYKNEPLSAPISQASGIPQVLVKIGVFAVAGATAYYCRDSLVDTFSPTNWLRNSK